MKFWLISLLLTLLSALIAFSPLWRTKKHLSQSNKRDELNKAFYFNRLEEIKKDETQGRLDDFAQCQQELQHTLLQDIPAEKPTVTIHLNKSTLFFWVASAFLLSAILASLVYLKVGSFAEQESLEKTYQTLPSLYQRLQQEDIDRLSPPELIPYIFALRLKLQQDPQNAQDWWQLGELAKRQENPRLAMDSYARAYQLAPQDTAYKLAYARFLLFSDSKADNAKGMEIVRAVLRQNHTNIEALSLLAFQHFAQRDFRMAAATWAMILRLTPPNDPRVPLLEKSIQLAEQQLQAETQKK